MRLCGARGLGERGLQQVRSGDAGWRNRAAAIHLEQWPADYLFATRQGRVQAFLADGNHREVTIVRHHQKVSRQCVEDAPQIGDVDGLAPHFNGGPLSG